MTTHTDDATRRSPAAPDWGLNYGLTELWSRVPGGHPLWVGGTADDDTIDNGRYSYVDRGALVMGGRAEIGPTDFDAVCTLYAWARPVDWGVLELRWGFPDTRDRDLDEREQAGVREAAIWVALQLRAGQRTLVRCQAGLNRSALVACLALVELGATPDAALASVRAARSSDCLFNAGFRRVLGATA